MLTQEGEIPPARVKWKTADKEKTSLPRVVRLRLLTWTRSTASQNGR